MPNYLGHLHTTLLSSPLAPCSRSFCHQSVQVHCQNSSQLADSTLIGGLVLLYASPRPCLRLCFCAHTSLHHITIDIMVSHWRGDPARPALAADVFRSGAIVAPPDLFESISCQRCSHSQVVRRIFHTYIARLNARLSAIARVGPAFCAPRTGPRMNNYGKLQKAMSNVSSNASHRYDRPGHRSGHYRYRPRNSDARKLSQPGQVGPGTVARRLPHSVHRQVEYCGLLHKETRISVVRSQPR